ncbi:hypothetical protein SNE40_021063 [Patella caerulea]|uniref:Uncharacterized protein n=1 Tax=Patella caerulea TaxID=87958 RepID=A0AAN8GJN0_PATCE
MRGRCAFSLFKELMDTLSLTGNTIGYWSCQRIDKGFVASDNLIRNNVNICFLYFSEQDWQLSKKVSRRKYQKKISHSRGMTAFNLYVDENKDNLPNINDWEAQWKLLGGCRKTKLQRMSEIVPNSFSLLFTQRKP